MLDRFGISFHLSDERWQHIISRHPELKNRKQDIQNVLLDPDLIIKTSRDPMVMIYHQNEGTRYYLAIVAHIEKRFIITAFITDKIKMGKIVWKK